MEEKKNRSELCKFVGENLKVIRGKLALSQEMVANETSLSVSHYRSIEQGRGNPSVQTLERISDTMHISLQEILMHGLSHCAPDYYSLQDLALSEEDTLLFKNVLQALVDLLTSKKSE